MKKFYSVLDWQVHAEVHVNNVRDRVTQDTTRELAFRIEEGYETMPSNSNISDVDPRKIASAVVHQSEGGSGLISLDPAATEEQEAAQRYSVLGLSGNPFRNVVTFMNAAKLKKITGLKTHP